MGRCFFACESWAALVGGLRLLSGVRSMKRRVVLSFRVMVRTVESGWLWAPLAFCFAGAADAQGGEWWARNDGVAEVLSKEVPKNQLESARFGGHRVGAVSTAGIIWKVYLTRSYHDDSVKVSARATEIDGRSCRTLFGRVSEGLVVKFGPPRIMPPRPIVSVSPGREKWMLAWPGRILAICEELRDEDVPGGRRTVTMSVLRVYGQKAEAEGGEQGWRSKYLSPVEP